MEQSNYDPKQSSIVAVDSDSLPPGWERVIDNTHGTYYIDHNTQRTQYERPYEIELTKGAIGFGFTLVEADYGYLLVRSVIPGGPAHASGIIRPGDILISAVGVSVAGLQHTDIARLFSTFAVGDRVKLTFARSSYVVDTNLVADEYLFSNGTDGNMSVAVKSNYLNYLNNQNIVLPDNMNHILVDQKFDFVTVNLKRGEQGFGFTINDSAAGQKVGKIQNNEVCANLKQGDILMSLNGQDITKSSHKEVVERLKNCPPGQDISLIVKRKSRFRSKTPVALSTSNDEYSIDYASQRICKTPNPDGLMSSIRRATASKPTNQIYGTTSDLFHHDQTYNSIDRPSQSGGPSQMDVHSVCGNVVAVDSDVDPINNGIYYNQQPLQQNSSAQLPPLPAHPVQLPQTNDPYLLEGQQNVYSSDRLARSDSISNSVNPSEGSLPSMKLVDVSGMNQMNQYNNFMNNDKLVMMQMQQQPYQPVQLIAPPVPVRSPVYHQMPLYSNSDMLIAEHNIYGSTLPIRPIPQYPGQDPYGAIQNNYYANNEEIALQRGQNGSFFNDRSQIPPLMNTNPYIRPFENSFNPFHNVGSSENEDDYEYHQVDLDRLNTESNWGIRLIGGAEAGRAISIGSIVLGGVASKNGRLKSGDEIISINGINFVGATHQQVVELISSCSNRASLVVRRKRFAEACEVVLNRNMDEGFGFVIISSGNCALIGRIIEGSPADRCQQLYVRDRVIAVNGRYITPNMQHPEIVNMIKECGNTLRLRIIPADCYTVELIKNAQNDNFGFSIRGGSEYEGTPLYILRVAQNGLARDLLNIGDQIVEINGIPTVGMTHRQAATIIKYSDPIVKLKLRRNHVTPPSLLVDSPGALQNLNQVTAEMKTVNLNPTPNQTTSQDGSTPSDGGSSNQHNNSISNSQTGLVFSQNMPLCAT